MKILVKNILFTFFLGMFFSNPLSAIDEDYFIPYTDNYGYEYDPETATYIKKDNPAPVVTDNQPASTVDMNNAIADQQIVSAIPPNSTEDAETSSRIPLVVGAVILILGLVIVFTRIQKKSTSN